MGYGILELEDCFEGLEPTQQLDVCQKALADASLNLDDVTKDSLTKRVSLLQVLQLKNQVYPPPVKKDAKKGAKTKK